MRGDSGSGRGQWQDGRQHELNNFPIFALLHITGRQSRVNCKLLAVILNYTAGTYCTVLRICSPIAGAVAVPSTMGVGCMIRKARYRVP